MTGERTVTVNIGGNPVEFRKLTPYDRADILKLYRQAERENLLQDLKDVGASKEEMLGELRAFAEKPLTDFDFVRFVNTPSGQATVFDRALSHLPAEDAKAAKDAMAMNAIACLELAAQLCNLSLGPVEHEQGQPTDPTKAPKPEDFYSQTETAPTTKP